MKLLFKRTLFAFVLVFSSFFISHSVEAIGLSPAEVKINNITNGMSVKKTVFLSRENAADEQAYRVKVSGEGSKYLSFPEQYVRFTRGANSSAFNFFVSPVAAPNGLYHVILDFEGVPVDEKGNPNESSVSVMPGVALVLTFEVTDQEIKNFSVSTVYVENSEVGQPVVFYFDGINGGNVDAKPEKIVVKMTSQSDPSDTRQVEIPGSELEAVAPSQTSKITFSYKNPLKEGTYYANVQIYADGKIIREQSKIVVTIFPPGTMSQAANFSALELNDVEFSLGEYVKIVGKIENTGNIPIEPTFYVEILKDEKIIDVLRANPKILLRNQNTDFELNYQITEPGDYTAQAHFEYGINKTEKKTAEFFVKTEVQPSYYIGYVVVGLIVLLLLVLIIKKIIRKDEDYDDYEDDEDYDDEEESNSSGQQDNNGGPKFVA